MNNKITFVHAPLIRYDQNYGTLFIPMWAYTLAAFVPDPWHKEIVDTIVDDIDDVDQSDVFAFSGINQDLDSILDAHRHLKRKYPQATFIIGGPITWSFEQERKLSLLNEFDHLFILDGEQTLPAFLTQFAQRRTAELPKIIRAQRFPLSQARPIDFALFEDKADAYYGAVVEVSRGCPFLCEFCDIRVLPSNNKSNNKDPALIVEEMDAYYRLGVRQFQFACDNFIGDIQWARACVEAIVEWKQKVGAEISIFTWLTINLYKLPDLMKCMREAGFSILFIGIESVNDNSLLETAKVQNQHRLEEAVVAIQAFGFIIAPGFIFGFDSDTPTTFDDTLDFMQRTGMIGGDPSFLMALPGTPLFERMKRTGRLVHDEEMPTVREKITTNIRYLQDADQLTRGFLDFLSRYNSATYQYARFRRHLEIISDSPNFIAVGGGGYGSPLEYLKLQMKDADNRAMFFKRLGFVLTHPSALWAALRARAALGKLSAKHKGLGIHFNYWFYVWTNLVLKYDGLNPSDFELHSVDPDFNMSRLLESPNNPEQASGDTTRGDTKVSHQQRYTNRALERLVNQRES